MAVGPSELPVFNTISGVRLGVACAGIKKPGRKDVVVIECPADATVASVFTKNAFCAAPVQVAKKHLEKASPRYFLVNTGNANAGTGSGGVDAAARCCASLAEKTGVADYEVLPFSTGVIGEPLPVDKIEAVLADAVADLSENNWASAAEGILTTDTRPKGAVATVEINGETVHISGISKGSGMIKPNMATMLGYIATDAKIDQVLLQQMLTVTTNRSFNRITIDSDTSTNDACMLVATGRSAVITADDTAAVEAFQQALDSVSQPLAHAIVKDGEGATKFVEISVTHAGDSEEALEVAFTVAHSPLVKTALFASDANWGRILAAVGRADVRQLAVDNINIWLGDVQIVEMGGRCATYTEEAGSAVMAQENISIRIDLARGESAETVWTTDLSHDYVSINADYRS
ncbi:bifunctional glutamate N-acetyltransferase/amino-acid acetyltransferase ArgJ [Oceanospirillum linum]|uniref:Arginine biosynthesis bifunctional protein ArgJ n=1 Tax=Oceanospirillum linum TaxID=966 RepID=A0A1T1HFC5_OCELI|nr:bifunctional glutamate N-acetyltransferase/amino-acid acetyltransferase ArgJ [Oceanospirillum linum]OOV88417.1 bifunctional ornithine acetyltransferase/N-acetylglutamate synthase [Oceanospirillum linum]SEF55536.1 glutamate N-acetyltransferase [Oleiphilus messinensis]SMP05254.1 glutamate N-acetyltransferase [Oceanospirillum linum]